MEENNSQKENIVIEKSNIDECQKKFENHILDNINDFEKIKNNLINLSLEGKTESELVRSFSYKIYLNTLSSNKDTTLKKWLQETLSQRNSYKENIKRNNNIESSEDKREINENEENEPRFQDINIFKEPIIKEIENNILFLFQNKNSKNILDMLIIALYPFYIKSDNKNYNEELFEEWANKPKNNIKDIYNFFHDEDEFESDLYYLMDHIMKLGINKFYETNNDKNKNYLSIRIQKIIDKLKIHNNKLYNHFKNLDFDINIILQKWLKNFFTEEFSPKNCIAIWDSILANEAKKSEELIYIDYFCISMLDCMSEDLLKKDKNEIGQRLLSYPFLENINILISLVDKIKSKENNISNIDNRKRNSSTTTGPGSMANFLYSTNKKNSQTKSVKTPNLMFGGDYSNKKGNTTLTQNINQTNNNKRVIPKKVPMFENIKNNSKNNNKTNTNNNRPTFEFTKGYTVSNSENLKMLHELKGLIDIYINEFSNDDKMKISFLIDNLSKEL